MGTSAWQHSQASLLGMGISCEEESESVQISLESMYGVHSHIFIPLASLTSGPSTGAIWIFCAVWAVACLLGIAQAAGLKYKLEDSEGEVLQTEGEMLKHLVEAQAHSID